MRVITITSGKGGVGKTLTSLNLAFSLIYQGYKVLLLDGDLDLANIDIILKIVPKYNIRDFFKSSLNLDDIIIKTKYGLDIIAAGSGIKDITDLNLDIKNSLNFIINKLTKKYDYIIIDTPSGISNNVLLLNDIASDIFVITTLEPHATTDAYALIKTLSSNYNKLKFFLIINMVKFKGEGIKAFQKISEVSYRFLGVNLFYLGSVPQDDMIQYLIIKNKFKKDFLTKTISGQAWKDITTRFIYDFKFRSYELDYNNFKII